MLVRCFGLTFSVRHMLDHVAVFDEFNHPTNKPLCTLWCVVDSNEGVGTFGCCGHFELLFVFG